MVFIELEVGAAICVGYQRNVVLSCLGGHAARDMYYEKKLLFGSGLFWQGRFWQVCFGRSLLAGRFWQGLFWQGLFVWPVVFGRSCLAGRVCQGGAKGVKAIYHKP